MKLHWLLAGSALVLTANTVHAQDTYPRFTGDIAIEIENDFTFDSDDETAEVNDLFTTTEAALALEFSAATSLNATLLLEPIADAEANEDRIFEDHGIFAEELYLSHDFGPAAVSAGKFDPAFGFAWDAAPGIFGVDFAEDYELTERIGVSVEVPVDLGFGEAAIAVSAFMADRTFLSQSLINDRGNANENDGGVSNTDTPESVVLSLYGQSNELSYNVAVRRQAAGQGDTNDEFGFVAGAAAPLGIADIEVLGEVAYFTNFDGGPDSAGYVTLGAAIPVGPVNLSAVYTLREVQNTPTDHLITASAEYEVVKGVTLSAGYKFAVEGGSDSHTVGSLLVYEFGF